MNNNWCKLPRNYNYAYQIGFFALLSLFLVTIIVVIVLAAIGYFENPEGYCKLTEGDVEICKQIKSKSCAKEGGEFFLQSKDCKPEVLFDNTLET